MEHSKNFEKVRYYYSTQPKLWDIDRVWIAVGKWITEWEYTEITGFTFPNKV